jgi:hypothetical protein
MKIKRIKVTKTEVEFDWSEVTEPHELRSEIDRFWADVTGDCDEGFTEEEALRFIFGKL